MLKQLSLLLNPLSRFFITWDLWHLHYNCVFSVPDHMMHHAVPWVTIRVLHIYRGGDLSLLLLLHGIYKVHISIVLKQISQDKNSCLKKIAFRFFLELNKFPESLTVKGRSFHSLGVAFKTPPTISFSDPHGIHKKT